MISGITADPLQVGEDFEVTCMSDGGNPPAKITWVIVSKLRRPSEKPLLLQVLESYSS